LYQYLEGSTYTANKEFWDSKDIYIYLK